MVKSVNGLISILNCISVTIFCFQLVNGFFFSVGDSSQLRHNTEREVRLLHFTGSDIDSAFTTSYSVNNAEEVLAHIDTTKPTALYIHGFQESPNNESIRTVADAYLRRGDHNFILLDWSDWAYVPYLSAIIKVREIAQSIAIMLDRLVENGLPANNLHIVGHSMGGQMAGFIGNYTSFVVPRITALDPAAPGYYQFGAYHLNSKNAKFVDVIHTDSGIYGAQAATGTVDCYPNGGSRPQPGCALFGIPLTPTDLCSHWRSWRFWAESLLNEEIFPALKCGSYDLFLAGKCNKNQADYCGFRMPSTRHSMTCKKLQWELGPEIQGVTSDPKNFQTAMAVYNYECW